MEFNLTLTLQAGGRTIQSTSLQSAGASSVLDKDIPSAQTNVLYDLPGFKADKVKSLMLLSTVDATLKTNSSSDPDDTIELAAGVGVAWDESMAFDCPFTADVTGGIYVTNTDAGHLQVYALVDPT